MLQPTHPIEKAASMTPSRPLRNTPTPLHSRGITKPVFIGTMTEKDLGSTIARLRKSSSIILGAIDKPTVLGKLRRTLDTVKSRLEAAPLRSFGKIGSGLAQT